MDSETQPADPTRRLLRGTLLALASLGLLTSCEQASQRAKIESQRHEGCSTSGHATFYEDNPLYRDLSVPFGTPTPDPVADAPLERCSTEMERAPSSYALLVERGDALVFERYFHGATASTSANVHSVSKSILSALTGVAIAARRLDLSRYIATWLPGSREDARTRLTVRHLLTMTAGLSWTEDETEYQVEESSDWVASILRQRMLHEPGVVFNYSSGLTHVLSAVLAQANQLDTCQAAHRDVLAPLGVDAEHWGRDPQGIDSGGYNVYLTARELARFGLLYQRGGELEGRRILPREWVSESLTEHVRDEEGNGYGYLFWHRTIGSHRLWTAWGFGGQMIYLVPELDAIVVTTANTRDFEDDITFDEIVGGCVLPALATPGDRR